MRDARVRGVRGADFRLVLLFGWLGSSAVCMLAIVVGLGYFVYVICRCVQDLYASNVGIKGASRKWGSTASKYVKREVLDKLVDEAEPDDGAVGEEKDADPTKGDSAEAEEAQKRRMRRLRMMRRRRGGMRGGL